MKKLAIATFVSATLTACGGGGSSEPENKKPIVNKAPTVTLQSEGSYLEQSIVSITADATDSDGSITSYAWSQTAGDDLAISSKSSETLTFTAPTVTSSTTMSFEVTVTDNDGATAKSSVTLTIEPVNESPSISINSIAAVNEQTEVKLSANANDVDGEVTSMFWEQLSGLNVEIDDNTASEITITTPTVTEKETLTFAVSATDNEGAITTETVSLDVLPVNISPTSAAGDDVTVNPNVQTTLSGSDSFDEDGSIVSYSWNLLTESDLTLENSNSELLSFTPSSELEGETLEFELTVSDDEGASHSDTVNVYINKHPIAVAAKYQIVETGVEVSLDATASMDDGQIVEYNWTQTVGSTVVLSSTSNMAPTFTANFNDDEKITFELTVTDDMGLTSSDSVDIDVVKINHFVNDTGVKVSATQSANDSECVVTENKVHDCEQGRDADTELLKIGAGDAGFDYTKLDSDGNELSADQSSWTCVRDNHTGLVWEVKTTDGGTQHNMDTYRWGGKGAKGFNDDSKEGTYYGDWDALVDFANNNSLCGKTNWSIPSNEELNQLVHKGKSNTYIDTTYFPNTVNWHYWSATPSASDNTEAWLVDFGSSYKANDAKLVRTTSGRVRLVSGSKVNTNSYTSSTHTDSRYIISQDGSVTDLDTGLMWTRCAVGQNWDLESLSCEGEMTAIYWHDSLNSGVDYTYAGHSNWRLPNVNELKTIFDHSKTRPSVNTTAFPAIPYDSSNNLSFWTSTPDLTSTAIKSLSINSDGDIKSDFRSSTKNYVLLVRNLHN